jgi:EAL domain-containing protein (putative c-di-GMP-specific phosphodiesterase class I)
MLTRDGEPIPAAQFLPMAVRHGLIGRLDCFVVEKLLDYLAKGAVALPVIAVNISARTIADADATRTILALLDARKNVASRLIFEMTEFGAMQEWELAQRFSGEVRRRGARFALDNFGMLRESLMLVHALRPHYIKLSPGYTRELARSADTRFLVESIVKIARALDIGIFAQAVEDESLVPLLLELGFSGYQGYATELPVRIA